MNKRLLYLFFLYSATSPGAEQLVLHGHAMAKILPFGGNGLTIVQTSPLRFGEVIAGAPMDVVVNALDSGAAVFTAQGERGEAFSVTSARQRIRLRNQSGRGAIRVDGFNYGGDINNRGIGVFSRGSQLTNIRIGATAHMNANAKRGDYAGQVRLRITYIG